MAFVKPIKEQGIIISKTHKEAREERTDLNGKVWPATEEKYLYLKSFIIYNLIIINKQKNFIIFQIIIC